MNSWRRRLPFVILALLTIVTGLAVHLHGGGLQADFRDILGDALWASMIAWLAGAIAPQVSMWRRGLAAWLVCVAVEFSQLVNGAVVDAIRATTPGHLMLGSDFHARDLAAYALGVLAAIAIERGLTRAGLLK